MATNEKPRSEFFDDLKRVFDSGGIRRRIGKNEFRFIDIKGLQGRVNLDTNAIYDRYSRVWSTANLNQNGYGSSMVPYAYQRPFLYADYEAMDTDGHVNAALDAVASQCCTYDKMRPMLNIESTDVQTKEILENLFYKVLDIQQFLRIWVRNMLKYGDSYLGLVIYKGIGIWRVQPMSSYFVNRQDDIQTGETWFEYDESVGAIASSRGAGKTRYEDYEIAHFRFLKDTNFAPYGVSYLEGARKIWKSLTLLEDAALLHRITRSADKRAFFINIAGIDAASLDAYMQKIVASIKKEPHVDERTGEYNMRYNLQNLMEDYIFPIRNGDSTTRVESLAGMTWAGMDDVEYYREKMFLALKVPKAYYGDASELNGKATLSGVSLIFNQLIQSVQDMVITELRKIAEIHLMAQAYRDDTPMENINIPDFTLTLNESSPIYKQEQIAALAEQLDAAQKALESKLFSQTWVYEKMFGLSEEEYMAIEDQKLEDAKRNFRLSQIENEGNDPTETHEVYGTKHALASLYNDEYTQEQADIINPTEDNNEEKLEPGRPKEHASDYGTDDSPHGRDPLGTHGAKDHHLSDRRDNRVIAMENLTRKTKLFTTESAERDKLKNAKKHDIFNEELLD